MRRSRAKRQTKLMLRSPFKEIYNPREATKLKQEIKDQDLDSDKKGPGTVTQTTKYQVIW